MRADMPCHAMLHADVSAMLMLRFFSRCHCCFLRFHDALSACHAMLMIFFAALLLIIAAAADSPADAASDAAELPCCCRCRHTLSASAMPAAFDAFAAIDF